MVTIFQHTDRIMIKLMIGEAETGVYSAAITCIGITGFVFGAIIDTARPVILEAKDQGEEAFAKKTVQLYSIITALSLAQSIGMTLLAKPLVSVLYGAEYSATAGILAIAVWYITFGHYGSVRNIWILAEGKQRYLTAINVFGAAANVMLNLLLIPAWGAIGAAIASVATQFFTNVILGYIVKPISENNRLTLRGCNPKLILGCAKQFITTLRRGNEDVHK